MRRIGDSKTTVRDKKVKTFLQMARLILDSRSVLPLIEEHLFSLIASPTHHPRPNVETSHVCVVTTLESGEGWGQNMRNAVVQMKGKSLKFSGSV